MLLLRAVVDKCAGKPHDVSSRGQWYLRGGVHLCTQPGTRSLTHCALRPDGVLSACNSMFEALRYRAVLDQRSDAGTIYAHERTCGRLLEAHVVFQNSVHLAERGLHKQHHTDSLAALPAGGHVGRRLALLARQIDALTDAATCMLLNQVLALFAAGHAVPETV